MLKGILLALALIAVATGPVLAQGDRAALFERDRRALHSKFLEYEQKSIKPFRNWVKKAEVDILLRPPLKANRKIYYLVGYLDREEKGVYLARLRVDRRMVFFAFRPAFETERAPANLAALRGKEGMAIIGRLVDVIQRQPPTGGNLFIPIFEALHLEPCTPHSRAGDFWCSFK